MTTQYFFLCWLLESPFETSKYGFDMNANVSVLRSGKDRLRMSLLGLLVRFWRLKCSGSSKLARKRTTSGHLVQFDLLIYFSQNSDLSFFASRLDPTIHFAWRMVFSSFMILSSCKFQTSHLRTFKLSQAFLARLFSQAAPAFVQI